MKESINITREVMRKISESPPGTIFFSNDFTDLSSSEMIGKILSQSEKLGKLKRLSNGIYFKPEEGRFGIIYPSIDNVIKAIAERDKSEIIPTGDTALNILGLSTQVPMNAVYITNGSARIINIGKRKVNLKRGVPRNFAYKGEIMPLLVQALKTIGEKNIDENHVRKVSEIMKRSSEESTIQHDLQLAPSWIRKLINSILDK